MQVRDIMTEQVASCVPATNLQAVAELMVERDCGAIPIIDPATQHVVGIITDRDIVCRLVAKGTNPVGCSAEDVMTMPITAVTPDTDLEVCLGEMESAQVRRLLVVDAKGLLCGIVSQADFSRVTAAHDTAELVKAISKPTKHASEVE